MARAQAFDLNTLTPAQTGRGASSYDWSNRARGASHGAVRAHLGDIATPLAAFLAASESVVGCIAWITSPRLMDELVGKPVSLIVNKEFALRETDTHPSAVRNRANLARLTGGLRRCDFPAPLNQIAGAHGDTIDAVRCVGHISRGHTPNSPLLHHKFVVRLSAGKPVAVWTGSCNFSVNAESSLENAVEIHDPAIAAAYLAEWARVATVSEPMDFLAGKAEPNWTNKRHPGPSAAAAEPALAPKRRPAARAATKKPRAVTTADKTRAAVATEKAAPKITHVQKSAPTAKPRAATSPSFKTVTPKKSVMPAVSKRAQRPARPRRKSAPRAGTKDGPST
jgi:hypothetical protein